MTKEQAQKFVGPSGIAYEDESKIIWRDMARSEKDVNVPKYMNHDEAKKYCESIGAQLPTGYPEEQNGKNGFANQDSDFARLSKYMGVKANNDRGYEAQILPNLTYVDPKDKKPYGRYFWSSSVHPEKPKIAYDFVGLEGYVLADYRSNDDGISARANDDGHSVRCIVGSR